MSYSVRRSGRYSYSKQSRIAIRPIGPQVTANRVDQRSPQFKQPSSTSTVSLSTASLSTSTTKCDPRHEQSFNPQPTARKSLFCTHVVLSPPQRTVLVLEAVQDSYPAHWSASYREPCRSKIAAVQTAIEYEYRFTEYRFAEYEYDEIRPEARTIV